MNGSNSRKARQFWNGPGFYAVLLLLLTAIAAAGYWTLLPERSVDPTPAPAVSNSSAASVSKPQQTEIPVVRPAPAEASVLEPPTLPDEQPAAPVQASVELTVPAVTPTAPRLLVPPLKGETLAAFSVEELQYSQTLDDWRTHSGVDIAAEVGTQVLSACSGTVQRVWQDDLLGCAVLLDHGDGYETLYANLEDAPAVAEGEFVSAGQLLGTVGVSALSESALPAHLHFAVTLNGAPVDPEEFLNG